MTHGAIDGHSRLVVFLQASNNNRASTVYEYFISAIRAYGLPSRIHTDQGRENVTVVRHMLHNRGMNNNRASTVYEYFISAIRAYGLPSRIRTDQGRENVTVVRHMLHNRGMDRRSVLVGSSVHNQRIERLWRDIHRCVTLLFYRLFYFLEQQDILNPINDLHIYAVHYIFLPRINKALNEFRSTWNDHGIRTQEGLTPQQLFTNGMLRLRNSGLTAMDFFDNIADTYGEEEEGLAVEDDDDNSEEGVTVPPPAINVSDDQIQLLREQINPLQHCEDIRINFYEHTVSF